MTQPPVSPSNRRLRGLVCALVLASGLAGVGLTAARADLLNVNGKWYFYPVLKYFYNATLQNNLAASPYTTDCAEPFYLQPAPGEYGHYAAVRFTPPHYPFMLQYVTYELGDESAVKCNASLAHEVLIWVGNDQFPDAEPELLEVLNVPAKSRPKEQLSTITVPLPDYLRVEQGEHLFVAVRMAGTTSGSLCLLQCSSMAITPEANFWSNATAEPFSWQDLEDFGPGFADVRIKAHGKLPMFRKLP